ncbi:type II toxin-antitoxin system RelE/ParE family toxin [Pseudomonas sp. CFBP 8758]|uniref:type II toxin-antitoxin system RelE/ParE family toxin n=1 Tax=Pseudomonas sp. CFBP 8758 TaxID=2775286 RepID=UPI0017803E04|nr:type II toxin-antitoxin system RelE/ParE family toxin [Pseudomonas sp. CFBP 8758]MBD8594749.1 type II toxin-antitoxin system RelE/ParE family toxin [Pseudomonas sp. CFBP 8758]
MNQKHSDTSDTESKVRVVELHPEGAVRRELNKAPKARVSDVFAADLVLMSKGLKPMSEVSPLGSLGRNVYELKINIRPAWRCIYYTGITGKIVVLHVTEKTTNGRDSQIANVVELRLKTLRDQLKVGGKK